MYSLLTKPISHFTKKKVIDLHGREAVKCLPLRQTYRLFFKYCKKSFYTSLKCQLYSKRIKTKPFLWIFSFFGFKI